MWAWVAPGAQYTKNGSFGATAFCSAIQDMQRSAIASEKCQPGSLGGSTGVVPSYIGVRHWLASPPWKP